MPNAELILDTSERFIQISIDSSYTITGAVVELCTCMRQMVYETKDIAYMHDFEALSEKIDALAEQSHSNDIQTFSMRDEFATVDEVNEVLTNNYIDYALKTDIPTDYVNNSALTTKLNGYATTTALNTVNSKFSNYTTTSDLSSKYALKTSIPTDYVSNSALTTKLNGYATTTALNNLTTKINEINSKLSKCISSDSLTNIFVKSLMQCGMSYKSTVNYGNLAVNYIKYLVISSTLFEVHFMATNYTTERYMILLFESSSGWIIVYDFKSKKGCVVLYSASPSNSEIHEFTSEFYENRLQIYIELDANVDLEDVDDNLSPDYIDYVKYFAIINDGDDETVYTQLYGALMKCSIDLKV